MRRGRARRLVWGAFALLAFAAAGVIWYTPALPPFSPPAVANAADQVELGRYLATAGNCTSCHTRAGGPGFAGGVAFVTAAGTIHSTNITPHRTAGIGAWSLDDFRRALHLGIAPDGSRYFPAFPYTSYTKVTDADVAALFAYLRSIPASDYAPPANSFAFRQRWTMAFWNLAFFRAGQFASSAEHDAEWNRGAYLVEGLGHCGACHTPRNRFLAEMPTRAYEGGSLLHPVAGNALRRWSATNLTQAKSGLGAWSTEDLASYLKRGRGPRGGAFGPMTDVIVNSTRHLDTSDVKAMAVYITSLPPAGEYGGPPPPAAEVQRGAPLYEEHCKECHGGSGRGNLFGGPSLAGSAVVQSIDPASLINVIVYGPQMPDEIDFGNWETMGAFGRKLDDAAVAAVANYVRGSFGNAAPEVTVEDVRRQR